MSNTILAPSITAPRILLRALVGAQLEGWKNLPKHVERPHLYSTGNALRFALPHAVVEAVLAPCAEGFVRLSDAKPLLPAQGKRADLATLPLAEPDPLEAQKHPPPAFAEKGDLLAEIPAAAFFALTERLSSFVSTDDTRPTLAGWALDLRADGASCMVATDGRRLVVASLPVCPLTDVVPGVWICPSGPGYDALRAILGASTGMLRVYGRGHTYVAEPARRSPYTSELYSERRATDRWLTLEGAEGRVQFKSTAVAFPAWEMLFDAPPGETTYPRKGPPVVGPAPIAVRCTLERAPLRAALTLAVKKRKGPELLAKLCVSRSALQANFSNDAALVYNGPCESYEGPECPERGINARYLLDAVDACEAPRIDLTLYGALDPIIFTSGDLRGLITPARI